MNFTTHDLSELPPPRNTTRWTRRREAVVIAVAEDIIATEAALERYGPSDEEFAEWSRRYS